MEVFNLILLMFYPWEKSPGTDLVGGCMCPSTTLDIVEKIKISSPCQDLNSRQSSL
jgi:hypothetical protein